MAFIELREVSVSLPVYESSARSLKNHLLPGPTGGRIVSDADDPSAVRALDGISGVLRDGDRIGLVGHNGAGKSTLLRVLAGIYEPCKGDITIRGHVAPLFDIALGMEPEATGYENVVLRGLFLGLTKQEITARTADIVSFTGLGEFMGLPVRTYSAGMRLRLAFAISTAIEPEILLLDEGISAGDEAFIEKANERLLSFAARASIIVLASHSEPLISNLCNRAVLLEHGRLKHIGPPSEVFAAYRGERPS